MGIHHGMERQDIVCIAGGNSELTFEPTNLNVIDRVILHFTCLNLKCHNIKKFLLLVPLSLYGIPMPYFFCQLLFTLLFGLL